MAAWRLGQPDVDPSLLSSRTPHFPYFSFWWQILGEHASDFHAWPSIGLVQWKKLANPMIARGDFIEAKPGQNVGRRCDSRRACACRYVYTLGHPNPNKLAQCGLQPRHMLEKFRAVAAGVAATQQAQQLERVHFLSLCHRHLYACVS